MTVMDILMDKVMPVLQRLVVEWVVVDTSFRMVE